MHKNITICILIIGLILCFLYIDTVQTRYCVFQETSLQWEAAYTSIQTKYTNVQQQKILDDRYIETCVMNDKQLYKKFKAIMQLDPAMDAFNVMQGIFYINKHAPKFNIPVDVAIVIAFKESRFDVTAVSATDDYGIMQINYAIWGPVFGLAEHELLDAETNVLVALKILKIKLDKYGHSKYIEKYNGSSAYAASFNRTFIKYLKNLV